MRGHEGRRGVGHSCRSGLLGAAAVLMVAACGGEGGESSSVLDSVDGRRVLRVAYTREIDVLNALNDDEVALELSGELDPGVIKPGGDAPDFVGVVMPMRI